MHRPRRRGARPPLLALLAALLLAARGATAQGYSMGEKLALPIFVFIDVVKTVIFSYFLYSDDGSVRAYLTVQAVKGLMIPLLYDTWKYNFIGFCVEIMAFIDKVGNYQNAEKVFK
ncbi:hypothetical protein MJG53_001926 [Ovis ammon polii x Ovis aries]|uniref:Uncharacterized protein n=1 Tax=Ovis ammon polii x Ovis aries TaxID=2918886 RepID=A0ACB9VMC8_9CETA|nr:hypothetical protein MJG53_001926 [Ovis ammon polii x Ovis aries]